MSGSNASKEEPTPSATVVLLRDASRVELLLMQRAPRDGKPGPWVFPGGRVEADDVVDGDGRSEATARRAAVRETEEEAGLQIGDTRLETISRWITPPVSPRRFDTWFYVGVLGADEPVTPDGDEMVGHRWLTPEDALQAYHEKSLSLAPPTFVTVSWLLDFDRAQRAAETLAARPMVTFRPHISRSDSGEVFMLYPGDAGYDHSDPDAKGPRHRCRLQDGVLAYERD